MSVDVRSERWGDAFVYDSGKQEYSISGGRTIYIFSLPCILLLYPWDIQLPNVLHTRSTTNS
jgi:hypothetical protein